MHSRISTLVTNIKLKLVLILGASHLLHGCSEQAFADSTTPEAFNITSVEASSNSIKTFDVVWGESTNANYYQVCLYDNTQTDNCLTLGSTTTNTNQTVTLDDTLLGSELEFFVIAYNGTEQTSSSMVTPDSATIVAAIGYFKASNTESDDNFGVSVSLSSDGNTWAVGAYSEDSDATGIDGNGSSNAELLSGAVYVFIRSSSTWTQQAYVKASNTESVDRFGFSVSLSSDGNAMVVGAYGEDSEATGVGGNEALNGAGLSGAAYVFSRSGSTWSQQAYVKASNTEANDNFGRSVAISLDGNTLAVGANGEDSEATGIDGNESLSSATESGAVYVFTLSGSTWSQQSYIKASNTEADDNFGISVSLSSDGNTLAVGANGEDSEATGIDGTESVNGALQSGAVYVFSRSGSTWSQQAYVKASNTEADDNFGASVSISSDGNTLVVGADGEDSEATGIDGNDSLNGALSSGAAYVFSRSGSTWSQQAYVKASNTAADDNFGVSVSISSDGNTLAVGATGEDSESTGVDGDGTVNGASASGAVYVFSRSGSTWSQQAYFKASNAEADDNYGASVSSNSDGSTLAVGADGEDSEATGVEGDETVNGASASGAVYLY
ncbi:FG-GAP repeat protein [Vibrio marisflavi]|uniref:Integrin n=1 Tax=Vibrio marisflavi CECT 7928 TaxID=634439 RepID=A0ABN8E181_9VIBR|nr:FG-GAP repeat protein [Vibrio marisflavi]CAH0537239.1 hypothetical protein VMF7928_01009 [Vibrio marisflavi CECT 7928]